MTIGEFLDMHYMHGVVFDADYEKDMQLPFKVIDFTGLPLFVFNEFKVLDIGSNETSFFVKPRLTPVIVLTFLKPKSKASFTHHALSKYNFLDWHPHNV
ncbi:MAG: hypothetical protein IPP49_05115 [Saprospiraceae bacterium]|nr:hypothetical protein [Saprospiraceae bacterium]